MFKVFFQIRQVPKAVFLAVVLAAITFGGCAVEAAKNESGDQVSSVKNDQSPTAVKINNAEKKTKGATIEIEPNSPADTVRVFYKNLREKKYREALFLTNLRPAIEGLTDAELQDLHVDFEPIAQGVPSDVEINGEIITGSYATVTARLPDNETGALEIQDVRLRKESNYWVILTVDESAETAIKKEGNRYFFNLRIETHHAEAKAMLERIVKSQAIFSSQAGGKFGTLQQLVTSGLLPDDALNSQSTGYVYTVVLADGNKKFFVTAEPSVYGKTGNLSFLLEFDKKGNPQFSSKDNKGQPLKR
jgi:hypothetical protein